MADDDRVLLLRDAEGNCYALPWYLVERSKVPPEVAAELDAHDREDDADVSGFRISYFNGRLLAASDLARDQIATRPKKHLDDYFGGVAYQQGRVQLDGDWP